MIGLLTILVCDALAWFYADTIGKKDGACMFPLSGNFRIHRKKDNTIYDAKEIRDIVHRQNAKAIILFAAILATAAFGFVGTLKGVLIFFNTGCIYSLWFDPKVAKGLGMYWDYLGHTSETDKQAKKLFKNGKVKAIVMAVAIALIHVGYFIIK